MTLPSVDDLKSQAKRLRSALSDKGALTHGQTLDLVARQYGYRDWNTLFAAKGNQPDLTLAVGDRVCGAYLKQDFAGEVLSVSRLGPNGGLKLTIAFDEPVDVVSFDSFSAYRHRVTANVDADGVSPAKTSDGAPHMRIRKAF
ncbi:glyoxalase superfamily protein [Roseibium limicola]|uniref:Glyoxalase-related protein domain-containing protein n=1 Tax=Roseibium limicola TaxID=2816037 RepID=A0A939ER10_9HYPH|nr:glyoxalase superfamily protein [Roseibium limicola]MBO0345499.1 hypothetical protein [Roseibium limicola]